MLSMHNCLFARTGFVCLWFWFFQLSRFGFNFALGRFLFVCLFLVCFFLSFELSYAWNGNIFSFFLLEFHAVQLYLVILALLSTCWSMSLASTEENKHWFL